MPRKAVAKKKPSRKPAVIGAPTKYRAAYCDMLVQHMKRGFGFTAFAADLGVHRDTLYHWTTLYPEFSDARKRGDACLEQFYVRMGQGIATGQIKRLAEEEPVVVDGKLVMDPATGQPAMRRTYDTAKTNAAAWIFLCKNMLKWRDVTDVKHSGDAANPVNVNHKHAHEMSRDERLAAIADIRAKREEIGEE